MSKKLSRKDFLIQINLKGGIFEALEYGITAKDCKDNEIAELFGYIEDWYNDRPGEFKELSEILSDEKYDV